jgi:hypothetical protein
MHKNGKYEPGTRGIYGIGLNTMASTLALINSLFITAPSQHASTGINSSFEKKKAGKKLDFQIQG